VLYFCIAWMARSRMGSVSRSSVGDGLGVLHSTILDPILSFEVSIGDSLRILVT
jgi:hypothetical protein